MGIWAASVAEESGTNGIVYEHDSIGRSISSYLVYERIPCSNPATSPARIGGHEHSRRGMWTKTLVLASSYPQAGTDWGLDGTRTK